MELRSILAKTSRNKSLSYSKIYLLFFIILFLKINLLKSQIGNFPETSKPFDLFFTSMASNNFVYNAGYFSSSGTNKYMIKNSITLTPFIPSTYVRK